MATETIFDAASTALRGRLVIDASAGTGKTWSLSRIVMRLVAEEGFPIGSILLVTFTKAATEELTQLFYKMSEKLYQQQAPQGDAGQAGAQGGPTGDQGGQYYDADYKVVDDDENKK